LRAKRSNLLQCKYLNLRDCFVVEFILSIAEGLLAMTGEKAFYDFVNSSITKILIETIINENI